MPVRNNVSITCLPGTSTGKFSSLIAFKDGVIGGILSGITTTLLNIFLTTERMIVRLIREMWNNLVQAFKVLVFNPRDYRRGS